MNWPFWKRNGRKDREIAPELLAPDVLSILTQIQPEMEAIAERMERKNTEFHARTLSEAKAETRALWDRTKPRLQAAASRKQFRQIDTLVEAMIAAIGSHASSVPFSAGSR